MKCRILIPSALVSICSVLFMGCASNQSETYQASVQPARPAYNAPSGNVTPQVSDLDAQLQRREELRLAHEARQQELQRIAEGRHARINLPPVQAEPIPEPTGFISSDQEKQERYIHQKEELRNATRLLEQRNYNRNLTHVVPQPDADIAQLDPEAQELYRQLKNDIGYSGAKLRYAQGKLEAAKQEGDDQTVDKWTRETIAWKAQLETAKLAMQQLMASQ